MLSTPIFYFIISVQVWRERGIVSCVYLGNYFDLEAWYDDRIDNASVSV